MTKKKSHTKGDRFIPAPEDRELWFSALAADDSYDYNVNKAYDRFVSRISIGKKRRRVFSLSKVLYGAAAVVLILIISSISYWYGERRIESRFANVSVEAPLGAKTRLVLPDSTLVWLNAGSKIIYSQGFGVRDRNLWLRGEAYFEVRKNEKLPFDVATKELNVKVLGTKFNFRNYDEDDEVTVNLLEGKVQLENRVRAMDKRYLSPSEKMTLNKQTGEIVIIPSKTDNAKEWTNDKLFFDEMPLAYIVRELNRIYDVNIYVMDDHLADICFYAQFDKKEHSIYNVLDIITATNQLEYTIEGDSILLYVKR
ncbi:MAG: hypothetical protein PARBA_02506 [Parabacteroides sp.]